MQPSCKSFLFISLTCFHSFELASHPARTKAIKWTLYVRKNASVNTDLKPKNVFEITKGGNSFI